ncbi:fungal-specific transcription factor domain-containing protein [Nemania abortiva]|nr:fungal-specific transcription factor domain-containing protein [Nemania abortiva]
MAGSRGISPAEQSSLVRSARVPRGQSRRYGFACCNCRHRKVKCDGALPACGRCVLASERCTYNKRPSLAYAVTLQRQLKAYQERFERLRGAKDAERDTLLAEPITADQPQEFCASDRSPPQVRDSTAQWSDGEPTSLQEETSIGTDGKVCFYGSTSLYHVTPSEEHRGDTPNGKDQQAGEARVRLEQQDEMTVFLSEISPSLLDDLLSTYWCWPHHLHCVLVKKIFIRDLGTLGPYVTPFLLSAVLSQAARYSLRPDATELGHHFANRARKLLDRDIDRGSSIATIQGLLIFSARECACGRTSQGWLYSGMAFRMAGDIGLHLAPKKLGPLFPHFSDEDLAIRNQMFWSCYTWDKTISLCLGRTPVITNVIELPTVDTLLDGHDADEDIWEPTAIPGSLLEGLLRHRALSSTRFAAYCELCTITHDVLDKLYIRPHPADKNYLLADYLDQTLERLDDWSTRLPQDLLVREDSRTVQCPPLHILLLNLVYQTVIILLCRPYRTSSETAKARCTRAAQMTDTLFMLHVRRFGFRCVTWLQTYTMFVACTINVRDLKENRAQDNTIADVDLEHAASARLDFGLEILRQGASSTPCAGRCASIVAQLLNSEKGAHYSPRQGTQQEQGTLRAEGQPHGWQTGISALNTEPVLPTVAIGGLEPTQQRDEASESTQNRPYNTQATQNEVEPSLGSSRTGDALRARGLNTPSQVNTLHDRMTNTDAGQQPARIGTPFRWLPENVWDDGSWMLMDMEFDPNVTYHSAELGR